MNLGETMHYKKGFDRLNGSEMYRVLDSFLKSDPLRILSIVAKDIYKQKGMRKSYVMRNVVSQPEFTAYKKLYVAKLIRGISPKRFLINLEKKLKK